MIMINPIRNIEDYIQAQKDLESIFHSELNSTEGKKAEVLTILIEDWEKKNEIPKEYLKEDTIDYIYDLSSSTSQLDKGGISERALKLGEEFGELSAEILKLLEYKNSKENKSEIKNKILLESVDCLIVIFDIFTYMGFTKEEVINMSEKQINKWLNNINSK